MASSSTVGIVGAFWETVVEEMYESMVRTSLSPNIKERRDCSATIFSPRGELLAQALHIPAQLGSTMGFVKHLVANDLLNEGDVWVYNDPYLLAGAHPNDIAVAEGVFYAGKLVGIVASIAHHVDVGGRKPGSEAADNTDSLHDGLRIPPARLMVDGELATEIWGILCANTRLPVFLEADLKAQIAACTIGKARVHDLCGRFGVAEVEESTSGWLEYGRMRYREAAEKLAGLRYSFEVPGDDDGLGGPAGAVRGEVIIGSETSIVDLSASSRQVPGGINSPLGSTLASVFFAMKAALDPHAPNNEGFYRCIDVITKECTIVNPTWPAAVGQRGATIHDIAEGILAGLAEATGERGLAGCAGPSVFILSGTVERARFVDYQVFAGGLGATCDSRGLDASQAHITNSSNLPVEVLEREYPLLTRRYEILRGSGGAGAHDGGDGVVREILCLADECEVTVGLKNGVRPPRGVLGGSDGRKASVQVVRSDGRREELPPRASGVALSSGDVLIVESAGGGGWGKRRSDHA